MTRRLLTLLLSILAVLMPETLLAQPPVDAAESAYNRADYDAAIGHLSNIDGLLAVAPLFDQVRGEDRERVLFDLARCRFALGDTLGARVVLGELFRNDPSQSRGGISVAKDAALEAVLIELKTLRRSRRQAKINETSGLKASLRSVVLPGWGQHYRGRRTRAKVLAIGSAVLAAGWFVADRSYNSALSEYRGTSDLDLNLPTRTGGPEDPNPFQERFEKAESRASTARSLGIALASVWLYGIAENFVLQPGRVTMTISFD
jgi:hypothetical protein